MALPVSGTAAGKGAAAEVGSKVMADVTVVVALALS